MRIPFTEIVLGLPAINVVNIQWGNFGPRNEYVCNVRGRGNVEFARGHIETALDGAVNNPQNGYPHRYHVRAQEAQCNGRHVFGYPVFRAGGYHGGQADLFRALYANDGLGGAIFCGVVCHPAANDNRLNYCTRR